MSKQNRNNNRRGKKTTKNTSSQRRSKRPKTRNGFIRNRQKQMPLSTGTSVGNVWQQNAKNTFTIKFPVPALNCSGTIMIVPIHPLFWNQRMFQTARSFTGYTVKKIRATVMPTVPTTDTTFNTLASTQNCSSVNGNLANITNTLQNMGGETASAFLPIIKDFSIQNANRVLPMIPVLPTDIPLTVIVANNMSTFTGKGNLWIDAQISFFGMYNGDDISSNLPVQITLTLEAINGIKSSIITSPFFGFVLSSTCPNIDLMEMVTSPGFAIANNSYTDHDITHNSVSVAPLTEANDQGVVIVIALACN